MSAEMYRRRQLPGVNGISRDCAACLIRVAFLLTCISAATLGLFGQNSGQAAGYPTAQSPQTETPEGELVGGYLMHQSVDFGGRITETTGSVPMYNTLVNLQSGPRLLEQTLSVQAPSPTGALFDNLYLNSFGWGGDPSNALRFNVGLAGWYKFNASFRRDQNYFDYNLFANPLNPVSTNPALPTIFVNTSPHSYFTRRHMYDYALQLFPQRTLGFRFEYSRNTNSAPSFSSFHEGTDVLLNQPWSTTLNAYRFGGDWRILPKTTISYTQVLQYIKNDTSYSLAPFTTFLLPNGAPTEFGLPWLNGGSPCTTPLIAGVANPVCNQYLSYTHTQRYRQSVPTEQLNLSSSSIPNVDFSGFFAYSNSTASTPQNELFNGLVTRSNERQWNTNSTHANSTWVTVQTDFGVTFRINQHLRIVDGFRFYNFRVPGSLALLQNFFFNPSTVTPPGNVLAPIATFPGTTLLHTASSSADILNDIFKRKVGQKIIGNEIQGQIDFTRQFGITLGYGYRYTRDTHNWTSTAIGDIFFPVLPNRGNCVGVPLNPDGSCTFTGLFDSEDENIVINENAGIFGAWFRPSQNLRLNGSVRLSYFDNFFTRIDPLHQQRYRVNFSYTPKPWMTIGANLNILDQTNLTQDFDYRAHSRNYGFNATMLPQGRFSFDVAYEYTGIQQNNNICFVGSVQPPGTGVCVNDNTMLEILGNYTSQTNYGSASVIFKPAHRASIQVGYNIVNVDGSTVILNNLQPLGPLSSRYQQPLASIAIALTKQWEWLGGWNYYQYNETSFVGPTSPRYFHANLTTLALRYRF